MAKEQKMSIRSSFRVFGVGLMISCGSFVMGYSLVSTSMIAQQFQQYNQLTKTQLDYYLSLVTSMLPLGAIIGSILYHPLCVKFGEKNTMIIIDGSAIFAMLLQIFSLQISNFCLSRFILGLFCGASSGVTPVYLISISPPQISGLIGSLNQIFITIGIAVAYAMGIIFTFPNNFKIATLIIIFVGYPIIFSLTRIIGLSIFFPYDSIQRHFSKDEKYELQNYIDYFYNDGNIQQLKALKMNNPEIQSKQIESIKQSKGYKRMRYIVLAVVIINQLSGINAILFYAKQLFDGISKEHSNQYAVCLGLFQIIITIISGMLLDKLGRRTMMLIGSSIVVISLFSGYIIFDIMNNHSLMLIIVFLHIFGFSLSLGPVTMVYISQLMQNISLAVILLWVQTLLVASVSQLMIVSIGIGKTFLFFGIISSICFLYLYMQMLETKGLTRKDILHRFNQGRSPIEQDQLAGLKQNIIEQRQLNRII